MVKGSGKITGFLFILSAATVFLLPMAVLAADSATVSPDAATFKGVCSKVSSNDTTYGKFPKCATSPAECGTQKGGEEWHEPLNCLFLEEPIGGEPGYDLYKVTCGILSPENIKSVCIYTLWHGEAIIGNIGSASAGGAPLVSAVERGPVQAILVYEPGKENQGPFGLLYNYVGIIYKFMSGIIVGFVVLVSIIGGIRMTTSAGSDEFKKGKDMIIKALVGMALWFLASLILYTINPTFFAF
jgi:hypothetical protein